MAYQFKTTHRVQFIETDMAGIVHFSNFFRFMESTEQAFYRSLGFSVHTKQSTGVIGFPRVRVACEFKAPLRFEDTVETHLLVREMSEKSISYTFVFRKSDTGSLQEVARGELTVACVTIQGTSSQMKSVAIPEEIRNKLEVAPEELLKP